MAQPIFSQHADVMQDGQGNAFLTYRGQGGNILYQINSSGNPAYQGGQATGGIGDTFIVYSTSLTAQAFGVFNTAAAVNMLPTTAPTGTYRISLYAVITTTFVTNTAVVFTFGWTDESGAQTLTVTGGALTAGTTLIGDQLIRSVTTNAVTYTPSKTGSAATAGVAAFTIVLERIA